MINCWESGMQIDGDLVSWEGKGDTNGDLWHEEKEGEIQESQTEAVGEV